MANLKKNILIFGTGGYLGSFIYKELSDDKDLNVFRAIRKPDKHNKKDLFIDYKDHDTLLSALSNIDIVIFSSGPDNQSCINNPLDAIKNNSYNRALVYSLASIAKVKLFITFSTVHTYKDSLSGLLSENLSLKSTGPYGFSHSVGEWLLKNISETAKTKYLILRLSNIFGYGASKQETNWNLFANDFINQALENNIIKILSKHDFRRDILSIQNLLITINYFITRLPSESLIFNLSSGSSISLLGYANLVREVHEDLFGKQIKIKTSEMSETFYNLKISNTAIRNHVNANFVTTRNEINRTLKKLGAHG